MMEKNTEARMKMVSLFKWIWISYLKTAIIPLVLVELVFIGIYFSANNWFRTEMVSFLYSEADEQLERYASQESENIWKELGSVENTLEIYRRQTQAALNTKVDLDADYAKRLKYSSEGVYYTSEDKTDGGLAVFYSGLYKVGPEQRQKVANLLKTEAFMKDVLQSEPLAASIYFNTYDSLNIIYPYFDVISQYVTHMDIASYNFYYEADGVNNPERGVRWTDAYLDPAGHGWMASAIAPVYNGDFLEGVAGIDVTVATITKQILQLQTVWNGYGMLIGKDGTILALPEKGEKEWGLTELTSHHYEEAVMKDTFKPEQFNIYKRENLGELAVKVGENESGFSTITLDGQARAVSWGTIGETGWKLLIVVPEENIYSQVNLIGKKLFGIGTYMVGGLIVFYILFFLFLSRRAKVMSNNISRPLTEINSIVDRIGEGDYYQPGVSMGVSELQETAEKLIKMGSQLGRGNEIILKTQEELRGSRSDLQALLNSLDDVVVETDAEGKLHNVWAKNSDELSVRYLEGKVRNISDLFDA
ncbi:MAG: hypothetical protein HGA22_08890, partial [Clostridiales bacterium]|nr:hypothetical protein [Clostridiales bacterium]